MLPPNRIFIPEKFTLGATFAICANPANCCGVLIVKVSE